MRAGWQRCFSVVTALLLLSVAAFAATDKATVNGTVVDISGAKGLSGIRVELRSDSTKFLKEVITDADGSYTITDVPPAEDYRITAYRDKNPIDSQQLALAVGDEKLVLPPLREHPTETVITVETPAAAAPGAPGAPAAPKKVQQVVVGGGGVRSRLDLESVSTTISGVIKDEQLRGLPLANRNFLALGLVTPETHDVEGGSPLAGASFSIAGSRATSNMFLLDGTDNVARSSNQAIPFQVNEAVQEFRVVSSTPNAEYGGAAGGIVNVVTRRGTSAWHGSAFGYVSKDALNGNSPLSVYNGSGFDQAAALAGGKFDYLTGNADPNVSLTFGPPHYNDYAATAAYLGFCTDSISRTATTDRYACNTGGFGRATGFNPDLLRSANDRYVPYDSRQYGLNAGGPLVKDKFFIFGSYEGTIIDNPNNVFERVPSSFDKTYNPLLAAGIPTAAAYSFTASDPNYLFAQRILGLYPASNVVAVPGALEFYKGFAPNYTHVHNGLFRGDWVENSRSSWTFRYVAQNLNQLHDDTMPKGLAYPGNGAVRDAFNQNLLISNSREISSSFSLDSRIGFTRFRVNETPQDSRFSLSGFGLPGSQLPTFAISGIDPQTSGATPKTDGAAASWTDSFWDYTYPLAHFCAAPPCAANTFQLYNANAQFPTLDGQFPLMRIGAPLSAPGQRRDTTFLGEEGISLRRGHHLWKLGGGYRHFGNRVMNAGLSRGLVVSTNIGEFTSDSESSIFHNAGVLPGDKGAFRAPSFDFALRQPAPYVGRFGSYALNGYAQDTWRVSNRFTLNAGLRYDFFSTPTEVNNQTWNFDPGANGLVQQHSNRVVDPYGQACTGSANFRGTYSDNGFTLPWRCDALGGADLKSHRNGVAPRFGFAWDPSGKGNTVLRAGLAYMFDQLPMSDYTELMFNRPTPLTASNPQFTYGRNWGSSYCVTCGLGNVTVNPANLTGTLPSLQPNGSIINVPRTNFQSAVSPTGISAIDNAHSDLPYTRQISITLQQKMTPKVGLEVGYVGTSGFNLPTVANTGFRNEFSCVVSCDNAVPVFTLANRGASSYHSLLAKLRTAQYKGLAMNVTYVWSKSMDNVAGSTFPLIPVTLRTSVYGFAGTGLGVPGSTAFGSTLGSGFANTNTGSLGNAGSSFADALNAGLTTTGAGQVFVSRYNIPQDPTNYLRDDYGRSDFNVTHRFVVDYSWDLPFLNRTDRVSNWFGKWRVSSIIVAQTGQPFTVFAGPIGGELTQRAHLVSAPIITGNPNAYINASAFALAAIQTPQGNADFGCNHGFARTTSLYDPTRPATPCIGFSTRNEFVGPGYASIDMAVQKGFQVAEGRSLNFRAEVFNLADRANFYNPISLLSTDGVNLNSDFGKIKSAHNPRQIQLAVRFAW